MSERLPFCGGTDAAAIYCSAHGLPYMRSAWEVWAERKAPAALPKRAPVERRWLALGNTLEPFVLGEYAAMLADDGLTVGPACRVAAPPPSAWMRGSLDATVASGGQVIGLVDAKTSRQRHHWFGNEDGQRIETYPPGYEVQVRWYLGLLRLDQAARGESLASFADLLAFDLMSAEVYRRTIQYDEDEWSRIYWTVSEWWDRYIIGDEVPPDDDSECCQRWHLYCRYRATEGKESTTEQAEAMRAFADAGAARDAAGKDYDRAKGRLLSMMDSDKLTTGGPKGPYVQIQPGPHGSKVLRAYRFPKPARVGEE